MNSKQAAEEILEGYSPAQIAVRGSLATVQTIQSLFVAVGEGRIRQSDLLFALGKDLRIWADLFMNANEDLSPTDLQQLLNRTGQNYDLEEVQLYLRFRKSGLHIGDMYADIVALERGLHQKIKSVLVTKFGKEENEWWGSGVPEAVRTACVKTRESESDYENHSYSYTTFINLWEILEKNWALVGSQLPPSLRNRKELKKALVRLNSIRNQLMHPVREALPTEGDYEFVKKMRYQLDSSLWQTPQP